MMIDRKQLAVVAHQVAGHGQGNTSVGLLQDKDTVLKPIHLSKKAGRCELEFYERELESIPARMRPFVPAYYGHQQVMDCTTKSVQDYIRLENLLQGFSKPCLIDIKLGYRTYDEDATTLKISQEIAKYFYQKTIGFRLSGMKIYDEESESYQVFTREWGRSIAPSKMRQELRRFFYPASREGRDDVLQNRLQQFIERLRELLEIFEHVNDKYRFYASSILCVYEGDWNSESTLNKIELRLIDFAHVFPIKEELESERRDFNVIFGLKSVLNYIVEMTPGSSQQ